MGKFKDAFWKLAGNRAVKPEANPSETVDGDVPHPVSREVVEPSTTDAKPAVKDSESDKGDLEAKLASRRCDLHPLYLLQDSTIEILLPNSTVLTKVKGSRCTKESCNRYYVRDYGYFPFTPSDNPDFRQTALTLKCVTHEYDYMAVVKINGDFTWACLELGCTNMVPYHEP